MALNITAIILTYNCERRIGETILAAKKVACRTVVVDSYSTDATAARAEALGCWVESRRFSSYAEQRNWAIQRFGDADWQLHLDADEVLSKELTASILALDSVGTQGLSGLMMCRLHRFMGRDIRHGGFYPQWHLRLFRPSEGRCENRRYDQHFVVEGVVGRLSGDLVDTCGLDLAEWTTKHNRWSDAEVVEVLSPSPRGVMRGQWLGGGPIARRRAEKELYYRMPILLRPFLLFLYRYVVRAGFLDGTRGLVFYVLQTLWFRFLVDAKLLEAKRAEE